MDFAICHGVLGDEAMDLNRFSRKSPFGDHHDEATQSRKRDDFRIESPVNPAKTSRPMPHQRSERTREGRPSDTTLWIPVALLLLLPLSSCHRETRVERATREKILLLGNGAEPKALDPHIVSSVGDSNILRALFEGLVVNHPSNDSIHEPGVAERWEPNADFSEWRFLLRKNAKWSNGEPVTAHDFVAARRSRAHANGDARPRGAPPRRMRR